MFKFKKIAAVLTSAVMLSSTMGFAMAASYPTPFVTAGTADVAVVYGNAAAVSDLTAAIDIQQSLGALVTGVGTDSAATVTGEAAALFSGGTKIYVNDSLNVVKNVLTKTDLPTVLADESFSGNVDATTTQTIVLGSNPRITYDKQPTSTDEPNYALKTSTAKANAIYNATVTFNKAVNLSHADSIGQTLDMFGQTYTIAAATDVDTLVLLQSAEKVSLSSDDPSAEVTVSGSTYTIELITASDTSASIKVTDSLGTSGSAEINEAASKKVNGLTVAVQSSDENNLKYVASIIVGADKITIDNGIEVTIGEDATVLDGVYGYMVGDPTALTSLTIGVVAPESDEDAIKAGESLLNPVFKTFKLDFAGFNIAEDSTTARETISIANSGDDKMEVKFTDHTGNEKTVMFAKNASNAMYLYSDNDNRNISVFEGDKIHYNDVVAIGNEDEGHLIKLTTINNVSSGYSSDKVKFTDVFTGDVIDTSWSADGTGTITVGGKSFDVTSFGDANNATEEFYVRLGHPDSSGTATAIIYPTIQTSKGAKVSFYEPMVVNISGWNGDTTDLTTLKFPDGDGYTDVTFTYNIANISIDGSANNISEAGESALATIGKLTYNVTYSAVDSVKIYLQAVSGGNINDPALVIFEEKDDNAAYEAIIVKLEAGADSTDGIGIDDVERTWSADLASWEVTTPGDSNIEKSADLFGTIITTDSSDSDQKTATISYPDEQIYAQIYMAEESATITPGAGGVSSAGGGQVLIVKDTEVSSVTGKNLIVVGGSCINQAAAKILGSTSPICGADFTTKTDVSANQYIIKTVKSPYNDAKIAMLVAGFEAADTINAVAMAKSGVTSTVDTSQVYPISSTTSA